MSNLLTFRSLLLLLLWIVTALSWYGFDYLVENYHDITFYELMYYLRMPLKGANTSPFKDEIPGTIFAVISAVILFIFSRAATLPSIVVALLLLIVIIMFLKHMHVIGYIKLRLSKTDIYDKYYVSPSDADISFPERKRNLIYIYLESVETCLSDKARGGKGKVDFIPELTDLALENIDFSEEGKIDGAGVVEGATFTTGAMLAQSAGIPLNLAATVNSKELGSKDYSFIPGVQTLGDVLSSHGYDQVFLMGSDATFGARRSLLKSHGDVRIFDYKRAVQTSRIAPDYYEWWGFEDEKLYEFAKDELLELSSSDKPFCLTMLTADTHFLKGYKCRLCGNEHKEQYANVMSCASRQLNDFVEWIKRQDFYKDTTVIVCGDHPTMDSGFIKKSHLVGSHRRSYVSIINPADGLAERPRKYTLLDLFPTTLAAIGATFKGDRLGLGVNLFSDTKTLTEEYGRKWLDAEMTKQSDFYKDKLVMGNKISSKTE